MVSGYAQSSFFAHKKGVVFLRWRIVFLCLLLVFSHNLEAKKHKKRAVVKNLDACSRILRGSIASRAFQNAKIDEFGLRRAADDDELAELISLGELVPLIENYAVVIDKKELGQKWRYVRPWVNDFLLELGDVYFAKFHRPLYITSAVRTIQYQKHLQKINGNAITPIGPLASSHTAGATIDISKSVPKKKMSLFGVHFVRQYLCSRKKERFLEAVEESNQPVFHIMIFLPDPKIH